MPAFVKFFIEFAPLLIFYLVHKYYGMVGATVAIIISSLISILVTYYYEKKIPSVPLYTTIILLIFGSITIFTGNTTFIKMKPTILYLLFAIILFWGSFTNRGLLKYIFGESIPLTDKAWIVFSKRWAYFFIAIALANEIVWRNFSEDLWVKLKVFGVIPIMFIFMASQLSFIAKNKKEVENKPVE